MTYLFSEYPWLLSAWAAAFVASLFVVRRENKKFRGIRAWIVPWHLAILLSVVAFPLISRVRDWLEGEAW